jgi:hypothetical protein
LTPRNQSKDATQVGWLVFCDDTIKTEDKIFLIVGHKPHRRTMVRVEGIILSKKTSRFNTPISENITPINNKIQ